MDLMGGTGDLTSEISTAIPASRINEQPSTRASNGNNGLMDFDFFGDGLSTVVTQTQPPVQNINSGSSKF